jgi:hypothetical protein
VLERMRQDDHSVVEAFSMPLTEPPWVECAVALHHCHLYRIGTPDRRKYGLRSVDDTASLRAMALLLDVRIRMQSGADPHLLLLQLAVGHRLISRQPRIEDASLVWNTLEHERGATRRLQLPGSRLPGVNEAD